MTKETEGLRLLSAGHSAAAIGAVRWSSPLAEYNYCRGGPSSPANPDTPRLGLGLKAPLRRWAGKHLSKSFIPTETAKKRFLVSRADGVDEEDGSLLLLRVPHDPAAWVKGKMEGEHGIPYGDAVEAAVHCFVNDMPRCWFGVMLEGWLKMIVFERDTAFEKEVFSKLSSFWTANVVGGVPPRANERDEDVVRDMFPKPTQPSIDFSFLTPEQQGAVVRWAEAQHARAEHERQEKAERATVLQAIGEHSGIRAFPPSTGITSVSCDIRAPYPNNATWNAVAHELLEKLTESAQKKLVEKHTPTEGTRVLRPFFAKVTSAPKASPPENPRPSGPPPEARGAA